MKKLYLLMVCFIFFSLVGCENNNKASSELNEEEKTAQQFFGIDIDKYDEATAFNNTISDVEYGGGFCHIELKVNAKQMKKFVADIEDAHYFFFNIHDKEQYDDVIEDSYSAIIKTVSGRDDEEADQIYMYMGSPKKYINVGSQLITATGYIVFYKDKDGNYDVYMEYSQ